MTDTPTLCVVVPASNEARNLPACLGALLASDDPGGAVEVVVASNGSRDGTAAVAEGFRAAFAARGWTLVVLDLPDGGKMGALNAADAVARAPVRAYLDADVTVSPPLLAGLARALGGEAPAYASGRLRITGRGRLARLYARTWARVPFMAEGVPGCGLFAVNAAGRARWGDWPPIISDDTFARLHFAPHERALVDAPYDWPVAEGAAILRVRRRQDRGVQEVAEMYPHLPPNDGTPALGARGLLRLARRDPVSFAAYAGVALLVRLRPGDNGWSRGR